MAPFSAMRGSLMMVSAARALGIRAPSIAKKRCDLYPRLGGGEQYGL